MLVLLHGKCSELKGVIYSCSAREGTNALDAAYLAYANVSVLRQQIKPDHRVHGIVEGKNWAPNSKSYFDNPASVISLW